jgi:hypothetical protein
LRRIIGEKINQKEEEKDYHVCGKCGRNFICNEKHEGCKDERGLKGMCTGPCCTNGHLNDGCWEGMDWFEGEKKR